MELNAWIEHPGGEVWVGWSHHLGPGKVSFGANKEAQIDSRAGPARVAATFSQAGRHIIRMQTIDDTAAFEFYCCHTTAYFEVNVSN